MLEREPDGMCRAGKRHVRMCLAVLGGMLACSLLAGCSDGRKAAADKAAPQVTVATIAPQRVVLSSELSGRISAFRKAEVRPQVSGILQRRLFTEGTLVKAGQALYKIDPASYQAALDSAQAALRKAEANLKPSRLRAERYQALLDIKAVSRQECEDAQAACEQAEAEVGVCRAALRAARIQLKYTDVLAPISGRIGKSSVTQGALVTANQSAPLAVIQQLDPVYVDVTQSTLDLLRLRERFAAGQLERSAKDSAVVRLRLENGKEYPLPGALQFADITVDESTGMVALRVLFPNPEGVLLPGMYARATLNQGVDDKALLVPQLAVSRDAKGNGSVFVLGPEGRVERRPIVAFEMVGKYWHVADGLQTGDKVVVEGFQSLRHGMRVRVRDNAESGARTDAAQR